MNKLGGYDEIKRSLLEYTNGRHLIKIVEVCDFLGVSRTKLKRILAVPAEGIMVEQLAIQLSERGTDE